jgi:hypothetical protein
MVGDGGGNRLDGILRILRDAEQPVASVKRWVVAGGVACLALALALLPPRGAQSSASARFFSQLPRGTPARQRAQALADEWRTAEASLRLLTSRRDLAARARAARDRGISLLVLAESGDVAMPAPRLADSAAHLAWRQLALGETKISVVLVLQLMRGSSASGRPRSEEGIAAYLAPDSTDRTTCIASVPVGPYWMRYYRNDLRGQARVPFDALVQSLKAAFGPCAFYAAYGTPSKTVRGWLRSQSWDLALHLDDGLRGPQAGSFYGFADPRYAWYWDAIYSLPPTAVGCLAHRADACRDAVLAGASEEPVIPIPDVVRVMRRWDRPPRLVEAQRFLGDVAHATGRDRFLGFWTSSEPLDTALAAALKQPVGGWTADWQRDFARPIRLGPRAPTGAMTVAGVLALLALGIVTITASRRQVR